MNTSKSTITLPASPDSLPDALAFAESSAEAAGVNPARIAGFALAVEEAFVNICTHAYVGGKGWVELTGFSVQGSFVLEITDSGSEFDPLSVPEPDTSAGIEERKIGGLGIHLIRNFTDQADWRRENGKNILRLIFHLETGSSHSQKT